MTTYIPVSPGIDMSAALGKARLTKKWLRDYLRDNPQKDFRSLMMGGGSYVNGETALRMDLTLEVHHNGASIALVNFQPTDTNDWGYQAVVS